MVIVEQQTRLPFVEKYRPKDLTELVSHTDVIKTISKMVDEKRVPHFLFYGPPGTGKTSTILAMAHQLYGKEEYRSRVVELNASDDRGIDVVRNKIIQFAENSAMGFKAGSDDAFKLIVLDEADAMTKDAQNALKRVIEKYSKNVRFCLICNHLSSIIPAIQSRCTRFRFPPLNESQILPRLNHVINEEDLKVTEDGKQAILNLSDGDMRKILNILQCTALAFDTIDESNVYACVGQPNPELITKLRDIMLTETIDVAIEKVSKIMKHNALSLVDVLEKLVDRVTELDIDQLTLANLIKKLSKIQIRVRNGCSENLQLNAVVASFVMSRDDIMT